MPIRQPLDYAAVRAGHNARWITVGVCMAIVATLVVSLVVLSGMIAPGSSSENLGLAVLLFRFELLVLLVVAGVWAYGRFRLPSIPWVLAYHLLAFVLALLMPYMIRAVLDQASASGTISFRSGVGEKYAFVFCISLALTAVGQALMAWFILAELAFAYSRSTPMIAIPAIVLAPRRHSYFVGVALLACAVAPPAIWLVLLAAGA